MNTQQKAEALNALARISIVLAPGGGWFVTQSVGIKVGKMLHGSGAQHAPTPEEAIERHWEEFVDAISGTEKYLVVHAAGADRRAVRWNGFMWVDVPEDAQDR